MQNYLKETNQMQQNKCVAMEKLKNELIETKRNHNVELQNTFRTLLSKLQNQDYHQTSEYQQIVKCVLQNSICTNIIQPTKGTYANKHFILNTGGKHPLNLISFSIFQSLQDNWFGTRAFEQHIIDINNMIAIKCNGNEQMENDMMEELVTRDRWKNVVKNYLKIVKLLMIIALVPNFIMLVIKIKWRNYGK
eukprot:395261_1